MPTLKEFREDPRFMVLAKRLSLLDFWRSSRHRPDFDSSEALDRVRTRQSGLLAALRREQAGLYQAIGERFQQRSAVLSQSAAVTHTRRPSQPAKPREPVDA